MYDAADKVYYSAVLSGL